MVIKSSFKKIVAFSAVLAFFSTTTAKAEIIQEITEGCSSQPIVSGLCILLSPFYTTTITVVVPSEWSGTAFGAKSKIIYKAKNDAATFVATNGELKGIYLEAAFNLLRHENVAYTKVTEMALAKAILAFEQQTVKTE